MSDEHGKLLDHDYDGIKELDNDLPTWWVGLFYFTIAWALIYMLYFHVFSIGYLQIDEYLQESNPNYVRVSDSDSKALGVLESYHSPFYNPKGDLTPRMILMGGEQTVYVEETREADTIIYVALADLGNLSMGKDLFLRNCGACHGMAGEGGDGPNITDKYWLHGSNFNEIVRSVKYGYPAKGMVAWKAFMNQEKIIQVASYLQTLQGTNPPNQKAPQGELVEQ